MKRLAFACLVGTLIVIVWTWRASASTFYDPFPSSDSTVVGSVGFIDSLRIGYFYSETDGHLVQETFTDTGLESVVGLKLSLVVTDDSLTEVLVWNVFVNDIFVGDWVQRPIDGTGPKEFNYVFPDIIGNGTYTVAMRVRQDVPQGSGSIALGYSDFQPGSLLLVGCPTTESGENGNHNAVPEPTTILLLSSGLVGLVGFRRRFKKQVAIHFA